MNNYFKFVPFVLIILQSASVCGQRTLQGSVKTRKPSTRSSKLLRFPLERASSFSFVAKQYYSGTDDKTGKNVWIEGATTYVRANRPGKIRIEDKTPTQKLKPGESIVLSQNDLVISDGKLAIEVDSHLKKYKFIASAKLVENVPSSRVLEIHGDLIFTDNFVKAFNFAFNHSYLEGKIRLDEFRYDLKHEDVKAQLRLSLDSKTSLPFRVTEYREGKDGSWVEDNRVDYSEWKVNPTLNSSLFGITIPEGYSLREDAYEPKYDPMWKPGMTPPGLNSPTLSGKKFTLESNLGKVILIDYWATWCGLCTDELGVLKAVYAKFQHYGFEIVSVSLDDPSSKDKLLKFIKSNGLTWSQIYDEKGFSSELSVAYKVAAIPFNVLIGRDGKIAGIDIHGKDLDMQIANAIK